MAEKFNVDFTWVKKQEGGSLKTPYVPVCTAKSIVNSKNLSCFGKPLGSVIGKSGVTVATGFDIGQQNEYDLKSRYRFPEHIVKKMTPFLNLKGDDALSALQNNKDTHFDLNDVKHVDNTVKNYFLKSIAKRYQKETGLEFSSLPPNVQTAIFSAVYNYGEFSIASKGELHNFWEMVKKGELNEAANILEKKSFARNRRKLEADLLRNHNK